MLSWGVEHGVGKENPAKGIKLAKRATPSVSSRRRRPGGLTKLKELEAAGDVSKSLGDIIRLLFLTGARKTEIAALRWPRVDLARKRLLLPPERTKAGGKTGERRIALSAAAVSVLKEQPGSEGWVFPATRGTGYASGVQKAWERVRKAASLPGVRLHDLRHSFASFAVADGASLYLVGKLLGMLTRERQSATRTSLTIRCKHWRKQPVAGSAEVFLEPSRTFFFGEEGDGHSEPRKDGEPADALRRAKAWFEGITQLKAVGFAPSQVGPVELSGPEFNPTL